VNYGQAADGEQISRLGRVDPRFSLGHHDNGLVITQRIDQLDRALTTHRQRQHCMGEKDGIAHRQQRQSTGLVAVIPEFRVVTQVALFRFYLVVIV